MYLTPSVSLTFNGTCEAAFQHYERLLGGKIEFVLTWGKSPMAEQVPPEWREKMLFARLTVGTLKIAAGDVLADAYVRPSGFQLMLSVENQAEGERLFHALAEQGNVRFPLQETFWASRYGQVTDRFGIPWEINCGRDQ
jgi:PhnB protein